MVSWRAEPTSLGVEQAPAQFIRRVVGAVRTAAHRAGVQWTLFVCAETRARGRAGVQTGGREGAQAEAPAGAPADAPSRVAEGTQVEEGTFARARARAEAGMSTAEYAVGTIAACGFAALLFKIVTSAEVRSMLSALIQKALKLAG
ncbi:hypothetical protein Psi02_19320 [Planotetraspora silvatica]|uniref:DUF4244 domain-containing protein n=1 Tax=Planotetraspora silvatica TaxID=234614 RepID=A0A8J3UH16_9ACTN|nr:DUF4244 domain-containing protein [Planotetraspora silvatica]GII45508.1 hypothetical protein Psi02_19320 [Planotetraspora silvatica]